jgi:hypothetical protein
MVAQVATQQWPPKHWLSWQASSPLQAAPAPSVGAQLPFAQ